MVTTAWNFDFLQKRPKWRERSATQGQYILKKANIGLRAKRGSMKTESASAYRQLNRLFRMGTVGGLPDPQLLEQFVSGDEESAALAFEAIVERHGPMVLQVCRTVLQDVHAADDAFQATFLVLARKARRLGASEPLAQLAIRGGRPDCTKGQEPCRSTPDSGPARGILDGICRRRAASRPEPSRS